jgi:hypothetical protein
LRDTCSFRHENLPERNLIELDSWGKVAKVCPDCLTLIVIHRRIHRMKVEQVISEMAD